MNILKTLAITACVIASAAQAQKPTIAELEKRAFFGNKKTYVFTIHHGVLVTPQMREQRARHAAYLAALTRQAKLAEKAGLKN